jgi:hypothetical protein
MLCPSVAHKGREHIIEIKLIHDYDTPAIVWEEGVEQIRTYRDKVGAAAPVYLLIFARRAAGKNSHGKNEFSGQCRERSALSVAEQESNTL